MSKTQYLPTNDLLFKKVFASIGNEDILLGFINDMLGTTFADATVKSPYSIEKFRDECKNDKFMEVIRDISASTSGGEVFSIEMQIARYNNFVNRSIYYMIEAFSENIKNSAMSSYKKGDIYSSLNPSFGINILDFNLFNNNEPAVKIFSMREELSNELLLDNNGKPPLNLAYFNLQSSNIPNESNIKHWRSFFRGEELEDSAPDYIKKAREIIKYQNLKREEQEMIDWAENARSVHYGVMEYAKEEARNIGWNAGLSEGRNSGLIEGRNEGYIDTAKNFIKIGLSNEVIAKGTNLSEHKIENLRQEVL
jgi:predicted transposase/invertase (TIGR01784 family)